MTVDSKYYEKYIFALPLNSYFQAMISDVKRRNTGCSRYCEVVSDYVKLKRSGSGFIGCVLIIMKAPSFHVSPRLGIFKCFSCGESGMCSNYHGSGGLNFNGR